MVRDVAGLVYVQKNDGMTSLHVSRLQKDKESLLVHVDVLSERLESQTAKVRPLGDRMRQLEIECAKCHEENEQLRKTALQVIDL